MSAEDTWNKLHEKELQLSDKEWDLYQRIEKLDSKKMEVMDQLLNDSHWLNDLDFLFEGSRYQSQMMDDQLEFQHQVRIMEYSLDEELEKMHSISDKLREQDNVNKSFQHIVTIGDNQMFGELLNEAKKGRNRCKDKIAERNATFKIDIKLSDDEAKIIERLS